MKFKEEQTKTKLRGGYYTPLGLAQFLVNWVINQNSKRILEPSCGNGIFFEAIRNHSKKDFIEKIDGIEINEVEAQKASMILGQLDKIEKKIIVKNFLHWFLINHNSKKYDAIIGNPPFIRYQFLEDDTQDLIEQIFKLFHLPFTKHTNIWVPFVLASIILLRAGGRLAMVVPAEILHVTHAQSLRDYLKKECSKILIVDPEQIWFSDTLQGAVLLLAEKKSKKNESFQGIAIKKTNNDSFLFENPNEITDKANYRNGESLNGKWLKAFLTDHEIDILNELKEQDNIFEFKKVAAVDVGIVTGANKFFLVPDETVKAYNLEKLSHPMFGRSEHCPGVIYDKEQHLKNKAKGLPTNFLYFSEDDVNNYTKEVQQYLLKGTKDNLHKRFKCRMRTPWYKVPSIYATSIGMLKRAHEFPRLIFNDIQSYTTDTAYRIKTINKNPKKIVFCFVNSLTALTAELEGRHYGGGVLELVPSEIEKLIIPIPQEIAFDLRDLDTKFKNGIRPEDILTEQDKIIFSYMHQPISIKNDLFDAWNKLRLRRQRKVNLSQL